MKFHSKMPYFFIQKCFIFYNENLNENHEKGQLGDIDEFCEKMDDFSSQLGMIKCSEIRHFLMKFPSECEF